MQAPEVIRGLSNAAEGVDFEKYDEWTCGLIAHRVLSTGSYDDDGADITPSPYPPYNALVPVTDANGRPVTDAQGHPRLVRSLYSLNALTQAGAPLFGYRAPNRPPTNATQALHELARDLLRVEKDARFSAGRAIKSLS